MVLSNTVTLWRDTSITASEQSAVGQWSGVPLGDRWQHRASGHRCLGGRPVPTVSFPTPCRMSIPGSKLAELGALKGVETSWEDVGMPTRLRRWETHANRQPQVDP